MGDSSSDNAVMMVPAVAGGLFATRAGRCFASGVSFSAPSRLNWPLDPEMEDGKTNIKRNAADKW